MFGYKCEFCNGIVKEKIVKQEVFKHKNGFVILENVSIGICEECGNRYYSAETIKMVNDIATGKKLPERTQNIPVAKAS